MPLVSITDPSVLIARVRCLEREAAHHKSELNRHRAQLRSTKASLATLLAECQARGISINDRRRGFPHGH